MICADLPGLKHVLSFRFGFVKRLPHSESHSLERLTAKEGASEGGKGIDRLFPAKKRYERMAGVANLGGEKSIVSEYNCTCFTSFLS